MISYLVICIAAIFTSILTLFSGFGLGTLLMPVFAIFFPLDVAIAMTAIVHLLNNLFKFLLLGRFAQKQTVFKFGIPAVLAAIFGASLFVWINDLDPLFQYSLAGRTFIITPVKLLVSILILFFAVFEMSPVSGKLIFGRNHLVLGGVLSGFFGGLSGHQGAFRSVFLIHSGMNKEEFIATNVVIACLVDLTRIVVYENHFRNINFQENTLLLFCATLSAFLGVLIANRILKKITIKTVQKIVSGLLFLIAAGLGSGLI